MHDTQIRQAVDIIKLHCGYRPRPDEEKSIYVYFSNLNSGGEFRFCGELGSGGKLYCELGKFRVSCYREDRTPERDAMVDEANKRLKEI